MKKRILVVEDEELITMLHIKYIEQIGNFFISSTDNSNDAIKITQKEKPDLILMDVRINGELDGIETSLEINKFSNIPILFITGNSDNLTISRINETKNSAGVLIKPIRREDLKKSIGDIFE
jgi:response regulator of citrate/malate metabolism